MRTDECFANDKCSVNMNCADYTSGVIKTGDSGSSLLAEITSQTWKNCKYIDVIDINGKKLPVLRLPLDQDVVVYSASAHPKKAAGRCIESSGIERCADELVSKLVQIAERAGITPIAFSNIIDSYDGNLSMLECIAHSLVKKCSDQGLAILNGENAILGDRLNARVGFSISGTMIGLIPKAKKLASSSYEYAVFSHDNRAVLMNCDGVGTKTEFYERANKYELAVDDLAAMNLDDAAKLCADARALSIILEGRGNVPYSTLWEKILAVCDAQKIRPSFLCEQNSNYLQRVHRKIPSFNLNASVVSTIDEKFLKNPPMPCEGEYLIAIKARSPRSNGISSKRKAMMVLQKEWNSKYKQDNAGCAQYTADNAEYNREGKRQDIAWHLFDEGKECLEFLTQPSIIFYPLFKDLLVSGNASAVYHMSGGAYNGKLARPLAKRGLWVFINKLFEPDSREVKLGEVLGFSAKEMYAQWPMGNEGFITTSRPEPAIIAIKKYGLEPIVAGILHKERGETGVLIKAYDGSLVCFSGKE